MKKLLKSEICGSVNSARDPHVAKNWLKSQIFRLKLKKIKIKIKKGQKRKHLSGKRKNALPKRTLSK